MSKDINVGIVGAKFVDRAHSNAFIDMPYWFDLPAIDFWWPPGHIIGWEHTFIHEVRDLLLAIDKGEPVYPDFYDGLRCQQILDAALESAVEGRWIKVPA